MEIGFIGLGNMGRHMATRLIQTKHHLVVRDVQRTHSQHFAALGAEWADSAQEVASRVDVVFVSLPSPKAVEQVLTGSQGVSSGTQVRTVVDLSTTGPTVSRRVASTLADKGITLLDAPVSGGTTGAENGTLTLIISGPLEQYESIRPLLEIFGKNLFYMGAAPGQAQLMKIINNMLCAASTIASFEGLVLGSKAGLDAQQMLDVLNASSGRSFATEIKIPQCVVNRNFPMRFTTEGLHKDVKLCLDEAEKLGATMWVNSMVRQFLAFAISQGDGQVDYGNVIKRLEDWAGTQFGMSAPEVTL